jgi:hypothetical protein
MAGRNGSAGDDPEKKERLNVAKKRRQLLTTEDAQPATHQHKRPCSDCPWARASLSGWLGGPTVQDWLGEAHGDGRIPCHVHDGAQCAGSAIYRKNICKRVHDPEVLKLPADRVTVFATPMEFAAHHGVKKLKLIIPSFLEDRDNGDET